MTDRGSIRALALETFEEPPSVVELAAPAVDVGEVLVRMKAASINAWDTAVASGGMKEYIPYTFPAVIGMDVAGIVEEAGDGAEGFAPGDRVFGTMGMKGEIHDGSFAELANPQSSMLAHTPDGLDDRAASSLGVAGTTAMSAVEAVAPASGDTVLVVGATGGVGTFAIQLAAARGAHVIASARPGDEGLVTSLGAAATVDYTGDVIAAIRALHPDGLGGLIDLVNRDHEDFAAISRLVRPGGHAASAVGGAGGSTEIDGVGVSNVGSDPGHLGTLADMVVAGTLRVAITSTYPLADAARALEDFTDQHTVGKRIISME
jgi:NADPH:quinone reductase-like Zn-dependent oxidoreductase